MRCAKPQLILMIMIKMYVCKHLRNGKIGMVAVLQVRR